MSSAGRCKALLWNLLSAEKMVRAVKPALLEVAENFVFLHGGDLEDWK
jgi:hypothetical protein